MEGRYDAEFYSPLLPLPLAEDVNEQTAQFLTERIEDYPGVTIQETWKRQYPYAPLAAHVIGFMGAITSGEADEYQALGYELSERVGQFGAEKSFESVLRGTPGYVVYEVRASGAIVRELERVEPVTGNDVRLSIDLDLQQLAEQALQTQLAARRMVSVNQIMDEGKPAKPNQPLSSFFKAPAGSVIVQNYQTGAILAMASYPTFDNRWFESGVSGEKLEQGLPDQPDRRRRQRDPGARRRADPDRPGHRDAGQPGDPGSVQRGLDVQAVRGLGGAQRSRRRAAGRRRLRVHGRRLVQARVDRRQPVRGGRALRVPQLRRLAGRAERVRPGAAAGRARRVERRLLLPDRRADLHAQRQPAGAAGVAAHVRLRIEVGHRPAVRVRRPGPGQGVEAGAARQGRARRERGAGLPRRRQRAARRSDRVCSP